MPSRYEPCGLNQMYSMRYGTVPVARATGGLADTVINYHPKRLAQSTGFLFHDLYPMALLNTLCWAIHVYREQPRHFARLQRNGMTRDFSWQHTAAEYEALYREASR
jgi:starch synthase